MLRELVLPEARSSISGERAYKFKHVLIREVAYAGLSKSARAAQHARFAAWLKERAGEELLEIRAFHLDRAAYLLSELDGSTPPDLAAEAAEALEAAGRRSMARESFATARKLFLRSVELGPNVERRWHAARAAQRLGDMHAVASEMEKVRELAVEQGSKKLEATALAALAEVALYTQADLPRAKQLATQALETLPDDAPIGAKVEALNVRVQIANWIGDHETSEKYLRMCSTPPTTRSGRTSRPARSRVSRRSTSRSSTWTRRRSCSSGGWSSRRRAAACSSRPRCSSAAAT